MDSLVIRLLCNLTFLFRTFLFPSYIHGFQTVLFFQIRQWLRQFYPDKTNKFPDFHKYPPICTDKFLQKSLARLFSFYLTATVPLLHFVFRSEERRVGIE